MQAEKKEKAERPVLTPTWYSCGGPTPTVRHILLPWCSITSMRPTLLRVFFVFENVVMRGKSDEEKAGELLCYLQSESFDYYYENYSQDVGLTVTASDYQALNKALIDRLESVPEPGENIQLAITSRLDGGDILALLNEMDRHFEKASFNTEAKFRLLLDVVMEHVEVSQFVLYRSPTTYEGLNMAISDFRTGRKAFSAARNAKRSHLPVPRRIRQSLERRQESEHREESGRSGRTGSRTIVV